MIYKLLTSLRTTIATDIVTALSAGAGAPTIEIYTTPQPANPATAITTQTLLGILTCSDPVGTVTSGVLTFDPITDEPTAAADGTAVWARLKDGDGLALIDVDITNLAGDGALKMNSTTVITGGPIQISSFSISVGGN